MDKVDKFYPLAINYFIYINMPNIETLMLICSLYLQLPVFCIFYADKTYPYYPFGIYLIFEEKKQAIMKRNYFCPVRKNFPYYPCDRN